MKISARQRWPLGTLGIEVPPIVFGTSALANLPYVIPEQRKLAVCGEWFQNVEPPVFIDVAYRHGDGLALESLGRMLRRVGIPGEEVVVHLTVDSNRIADRWEKCCRLLGSEYRPKLVSVCDADGEAWRAVSELKTAELVCGIGIATVDLHACRSLTQPVDWVVLDGWFYADASLGGCADWHARS